MEQLLLRPTDVAVALGVSRSRAYELISTGEIPSVRLGASIRVSAAALRDWVARRAAASPGQVVEETIAGRA